MNNVLINLPVTETSIADQDRDGFRKALEGATSLYVDAMCKYTPFTKAEYTNMHDSASRMAKALSDMILPRSVMIEDLKRILKDAFPVQPATSAIKNINQTPVILTQAPIRANSLCPHHFLPVQYSVFIAIKIESQAGNHSVYGLSKYCRAVSTLAKRPVIQEQYTRDIVELFTSGIVGGDIDLKTNTVAGCFVVVDGSHGCMTCRGVEVDTPSQTHYSIGFDSVDMNTAWNLYNGRK